MTEPVPAIVCDVCGKATPARFRPHPRGKYAGTTEGERAAELRAAGWNLGKDRDTCPDCPRATA